MSREGVPEKELAMTADYDSWKTTDPDDAPRCAEHGFLLLCTLCAMERLEQRADLKRDERRKNDE